MPGGGKTLVILRNSDYIQWLYVGQASVQAVCVACMQAKSIIVMVHQVVLGGWFSFCQSVDYLKPSCEWATYKSVDGKFVGHVAKCAHVCSQTHFSACSLDMALWPGFGNIEPHIDESRV